MSGKYLSFAELTERLATYEGQPQPLSENMQLSLKRAAAISGLALPFFLLGTRLLMTLTYGWSDFLTLLGFFELPAIGAAFFAQLAVNLSSILLPANLLGLAIVGLVFWRSRGFSEPTEEVFHWLAAAEVVVALITVLTATLVTVGFLTSVAVALGCWIGCISLGIGCVLAALGGGRR